MALTYDLLLKGGEVIDPAQGLRGRRDVAFSHGLVASVGPELPASEAREVIDVSGKMVTPGLLDIHGHFSYRLQPWWVEADAACLPFGVTTAVDAGTTGWANFPGFRHYIMERTQTRLFAYVHLCATGLAARSVRIEELLDFRMARAEETARCIQENRDLVLGLKLRVALDATGHKNAVPALKMARQVLDETGTQFMVHISGSPLPLKEVFPYLKAGDIATHIYTGRDNNILDESGRVRPEVREAKERGILLDTGCAQVHFSFDVSRAAIQQELWPHTLSTDRSHPPGMRPYTLLDVMTMFLEMGLPLEEVIRCVTGSAATAIGKDRELGTLRVGAVGDAAVLELEEGEFAFEDGAGKVLRSQRRLAPVLTVKDGLRWRPPYP